MRFRTLAYLIIGLLFFACSSNPNSQYKPFSLLEHGVPLTILAPENPDVKKVNFVVQDDITVKKGEDYNIQIFASEARTTDISKIKTEQMREVQSNQFFSKIMKEEDDGFVYESMIDSSLTNYGFRYFKIQGDKEFIIMNGLLSNYNLEQATDLYEAVRYKKN